MFYQVFNFVIKECINFIDMSGKEFIYFNCNVSLMLYIQIVYQLFVLLEMKKLRDKILNCLNVVYFNKKKKKFLIYEGLIIV